MVWHLGKVPYWIHANFKDSAFSVVVETAQDALARLAELVESTTWLRRIGRENSSILQPCKRKPGFDTKTETAERGWHVKLGGMTRVDDGAPPPSVPKADQFISVSQSSRMPLNHGCRNFPSADLARYSTCSHVLTSESPLIIRLHPFIWCDFCSSVSLIILTGGAYRPLRHDRYFREASNF
jgi:hypothetical protein